MRNILVVGGAGYIGSHTVRHLRRRGCRCLVVDSLVHGHREAVGGSAAGPGTDADFFAVDIRDAAALGKVFQANAIDAVIHFASFINVGESVVDPQKYYRNNLEGALSLLAVMLDHGVKDIVFSSTCAVYGEPEYMPLDEKHPLRPINPYGHGKLMVETFLEDYRKAYGLRYMALRYFNAAGAAPDVTPGDSLGESHHPETHLIPLALAAAAGRIPVLKVFGTDYDTPDGTCIRDYVHVDDLASAHRLAVETLARTGESARLNVGTGKGASVLEIIRAVEEVTGRKVPVEYAPRRPGDPPRLYADSSLARRTLGWNPEYLDIRDIVRTAWNWELQRRF